MTKVPTSRFVPLQSAPQWNGCGRPTAVHDCVIVKHRARQVISAIRTLENQLRLFSWRVDANGTAVCTGTADGPAVDVAQIALVRARKYVSGCRTFTGAIQLQCWDVSNTGALYCSGPATEVVADYTWLQLLVLAPDRLLTIGLTSTGEWSLTTWSIDDEQVLRQLQVATKPAVIGAIAATCLAPTVSAVAVETAAPSPLSFLTVMQSGPCHLRWTHWSCASDGQLMIQEEYTGQVATVVDLALTVIDNVPVTLLHRTDGALQALYGWPTPSRVTQDVEKQLTTLVEGVRLFSITHDPHQLTVAYITAQMGTAQSVRAPRGVGMPTFPDTTTVQMRRWHSVAQQWVHGGNGAIALTRATELTLCNQPLNGNAPFLVGIGTAAGTLHLVTWADTLQSQLN